MLGANLLRRLRMPELPSCSHAFLPVRGMQLLLRLLVVDPDAPSVNALRPSIVGALTLGFTLDGVRL